MCMTAIRQRKTTRLKTPTLPTMTAGAKKRQEIAGVMRHRVTAGEMTHLLAEIRRFYQRMIFQRTLVGLNNLTYGME